MILQADSYTDAAVLLDLDEASNECDQQDEPIWGKPIVPQAMRLKS